MKKQDRGISLISLIITIIVIIILAAIVIFSGMGTPERAQLTDGIQDNTASTAKLAEILEVGDYVEYIPDTAEYTTDTSNTGYTSAQTLKTETKDWRVLYVNSETGEVLLTTNGIVNDETYLMGTKGYFRGPTELNNICEALYSNSSLGITARSMTVEDLNKACNYTPSEPTLRYAYYPTETTFAEGDTTIEYNGKTYTKTAHFISTAKFYTSDGGGVEKTDGDGFTYRTPEANNPVYVTQTYYWYDPSSKNSTVGSILGSSYGWLASPCVYLYSSNADFRVRSARSSNVGAGNLYNSSGLEFSGSYGVRPLVSLSSKLQIDASDTARDGSTSAKAWKLIKK